MRCDDVQSAYLAGDASSEQMRHLTTCSACRSARSELDATLRLLDDAAIWQEPSQGLEEELVSLIAGRSVAETAARRKRGWWLGAAALLMAAAVTAGLWMTTRPPNPDWEVAVSGTPDAPLASGVVQGWNEPGGTRLTLAVEGLAEAPPGSVYEVWFSRDRVHISAGTFNSAGEVELWVGVARRDFPRIWVTVEPLVEDEAPSGATVLDIAVP
jgi:hypothetical protein